MGVLWTRNEIEDVNNEFLKGLEANAIVDSVYLAHGSPREPIWEYIMDTRTALSNFELFDTPFCFVGHSHFHDVIIHELSQDRIGLPVALAPVVCPTLPSTCFFIA